MIKIKDRIRVTKDFPEDNIFKGQLGTVVNAHLSDDNEYSVFLDDDPEYCLPVFLIEGDFEVIE